MNITIKLPNEEIRLENITKVKFEADVGLIEFTTDTGTKVIKREYFEYLEDYDALLDDVYLSSFDDFTLTTVDGKQIFERHIPKLGDLK